MKLFLSAAEATEGVSLALERVDHVHGGDSLALDPADLLVDEARDELDSSTPSQAANSGLSDAPEYCLAKLYGDAFWRPLSQNLSTLTTSRYSETREQ